MELGWYCRRNVISFKIKFQIISQMLLSTPLIVYFDPKYGFRSHLTLKFTINTNPTFNNH
jgi:hypothetical protein